MPGYYPHAFKLIKCSNVRAGGWQRLAIKTLHGAQSHTHRKVLNGSQAAGISAYIGTYISTYIPRPYPLFNKGAKSKWKIFNAQRKIYEGKSYLKQGFNLLKLPKALPGRFFKTCFKLK